MTNVKETAWSFWEHLSADRIDEAVELLDDGGVWWASDHDARVERPMTDMKQYFAVGSRRVPMTFKLNGALVDGDRAALEIESYAETSNGIYNNCYCMIMTVKNDKIVRVHEYVDTRHAYEVLVPLVEDLISQPETS